MVLADSWTEQYNKNENESGMCKAGENVQRAFLCFFGGVSCTIPYTPQPHFRSQLPWWQAQGKKSSGMALCVCHQTNWQPSKWWWSQGGWCWWRGWQVYPVISGTCGPPPAQPTRTSHRPSTWPISIQDTTNQPSLISGTCVSLRRYLVVAFCCCFLLYSCSFPSFLLFIHSSSFFIFFFILPSFLLSFFVSFFLLSFILPSFWFLIILFAKRFFLYTALWVQFTFCLNISSSDSELLLCLVSNQLHCPLRLFVLWSCRSRWPFSGTERRRLTSSLTSGTPARTTGSDQKTSSRPPSMTFPSRLEALAWPSQLKFQLFIFYSVAMFQAGEQLNNWSDDSGYTLMEEDAHSMWSRWTNSHKQHQFCVKCSYSFSNDQQCSD